MTRTLSSSSISNCIYLWFTKISIYIYRLKYTTPLKTQILTIYISIARHHTFANVKPQQLFNGSGHILVWKNVKVFLYDHYQYRMETNAGCHNVCDVKIQLTSILYYLD